MYGIVESVTAPTQGTIATPSGTQVTKILSETF